MSPRAAPPGGAASGGGRDAPPPAVRLIATFGHVGHLRPAPGTWGSLAAVVVGLGLHLLGGPLLLGAATAGLFPLGLWATRRYMAASGTDDPGEIVVDEVVGQWIALLPVSLGAAQAGAPVAALWPGIVAAFVLFRLFDIRKIGPVARADRRHDAWGVMLDDVWAGVMAAAGVVLLAGLAHGLMRL